MGDKFRGDRARAASQAAECQEGGTIPSKEPFDFADLMQDARTLFRRPIRLWKALAMWPTTWIKRRYVS